MEYVCGDGDDVTIAFGCKYGSDNDHLIYNFTSLNLLKNIQYSHFETFMRIYHILINL